MFYIGINQAVHPSDKSLSGNNIFAIICVYLFVVFYSFGWGPIPFILASECSPNHGMSLLSNSSRQDHQYQQTFYYINPRCKSDTNVPIISSLPRHGSIPHDPMALQLCHCQTHPHHARKHHLWYLPPLWLMLCPHAHLRRLLRPRDKGRAA